MASPLILAGQTLQAGEGQGQLSQYYGYADANPTTVVAAVATALSSVYTIPAGEPYAGAAYELCCGGAGTWASATPPALGLSMALNGTSFGNGQAGNISGSAFSASAAFCWEARFRLTCADGVSSWRCRLLAVLTQTANQALPGTAADNVVPVSCYNSQTAAVSSAITVAVFGKWGSTTGAPTITCDMTEFRKVA